MAYIGHPLVGDTTYGPKKNPIVKDGQALHARLIGFYHPITNQFLEFEVDPTESFFNTLTLLDLN
jgi:23S rRNA pseudouridine1911/1915/1917 synthase